MSFEAILHAKVKGLPKKSKKIYVKVNGSWKTAKSIRCKVEERIPTKYEEKLSNTREYTINNPAGWTQGSPVSQDPEYGGDGSVSGYSSASFNTEDGTWSFSGSGTWTYNQMYNKGINPIIVYTGQNNHVLTYKKCTSWSQDKVSTYYVKSYTSTKSDTWVRDPSSCGRASSSEGTYTTPCGSEIDIPYGITTAYCGDSTRYVADELWFIWRETKKTTYYWSPGSVAEVNYLTYNSAYDSTSDLPSAESNPGKSVYVKDHEGSTTVTSSTIVVSTITAKNEASTWVESTPELIQTQNLGDGKVTGYKTKSFNTSTGKWSLGINGEFSYSSMYNSGNPYPIYTSQDEINHILSYKICKSYTGGTSGKKWSFVKNESSPTGYPSENCGDKLPSSASSYKIGDYYYVKKGISDWTSTSVNKIEWDYWESGYYATNPDVISREGMDYEVRFPEGGIVNASSYSPGEICESGNYRCRLGKNSQPSNWQIKSKLYNYEVWECVSSGSSEASATIETWNLKAIAEAAKISGYTEYIFDDSTGVFTISGSKVDYDTKSSESGIYQIYNVTDNKLISSNLTITKGQKIEVIENIYVSNPIEWKFGDSKWLPLEE